MLFFLKRYDGLQIDSGFSIKITEVIVDEESSLVCIEKTKEFFEAQAGYFEKYGKEILIIEKMLENANNKITDI